MQPPWLCNACGERFAGISLFTQHRHGKMNKQHPNYGRQCRSTAWMFEQQWKLVNGTWHGKGIPEDKQWWRKWKVIRADKEGDSPLLGDQFREYFIDTICHFFTGQDVVTEFDEFRTLNLRFLYVHGELWKRV